MKQIVVIHCSDTHMCCSDTHMCELDMRDLDTNYLHDPLLAFLFFYHATLQIFF